MKIHHTNCTSVTTGVEINFSSACRGSDVYRVFSMLIYLGPNSHRGLNFLVMMGR